MPRTQTVDLRLPDAPDAVAARLRGQARWRLFPYRGSWLGGGRPLGGNVSGARFRLALDPFDWRQLSQAVAVGTLTPDGEGGTRLVAEVGLPTWVTWLYRLVWLLALGVVGLAATLLSTAGLPPLQLAALVSLFVTVGLVAGTLGLGAHVAHADAQVAPLAEALAAAAQPPSAGQATRAPQRARQTE